MNQTQIQLQFFQSFLAEGQQIVIALVLLAQTWGVIWWLGNMTTLNIYYRIALDLLSLFITSVGMFAMVGSNFLVNTTVTWMVLISAFVYFFRPSVFRPSVKKQTCNLLGNVCLHNDSVLCPQCYTLHNDSVWCPQCYTLNNTPLLPNKLKEVKFEPPQDYAPLDCAFTPNRPLPRKKMGELKFPETPFKCCNNDPTFIAAKPVQIPFDINQTGNANLKNNIRIDFEAFEKLKSLPNHLPCKPVEKFDALEYARNYFVEVIDLVERPEFAELVGSLQNCIRKLVSNIENQKAASDGIIPQTVPQTVAAESKGIRVTGLQDETPQMAATTGPKYVDDIYKHDDDIYKHVDDMTPQNTCCGHETGILPIAIPAQPQANVQAERPLRKFHLPALDKN